LSHSASPIFFSQIKKLTHQTHTFSEEYKVRHSEHNRRAVHYGSKENRHREWE
jgi:hypothetical protein